MQTRSCWIGLLFTSWLLAASAARNDCLAADREAIFSRDRLVAWCIVPFDAKKRGPEERAEMLQRLGFKHFAYDWRGEHIPTFDAEIAALKKRGIALDAWWAALYLVIRSTAINRSFEFMRN